MREVKVHKAGDIGDHLVQPTTILISEDFGAIDRETLDDTKRAMFYDALDIEAALSSTLPQGVLERVAMLLLERIATCYLGTIRTLETGDRAVVEAALHRYIGLWHSNACRAREAKDSSKIKFCDRAYEDAVETYKRLIGREPTV
ncbi:MAG: hypothetical protein WC869_10495 [Phycisphaerae bacterium]|jgi:hypothetical protein